MSETFGQEFDSGVISNIFYLKYLGFDKCRESYSDIDVDDMMEKLCLTTPLKAFLILRNDKPYGANMDDRDDTLLHIMLGINTSNLDLSLLKDDILWLSECNDYYHYFWFERNNYTPDNMYFKIRKNMVDDVHILISLFTTHAVLENNDWLSNDYKLCAGDYVPPIAIKFNRGCNYKFIFSKDGDDMELNKVHTYKFIIDKKY